MSMKGAEIMREKKAKILAILQGKTIRKYSVTNKKNPFKSKNWTYSKADAYEDTSWRDGKPGRKGKTKYRRE